MAGFEFHVRAARDESSEQIVHLGEVSAETLAEQFLRERLNIENTSGGAPVHVFYMIIEDRSAARGGVPDSLVEERLRLVWAGQRKTGQTAIHVAIRGIDSPSAAADALRRELALWISPAR